MVTTQFHCTTKNRHLVYDKQFLAAGYVPLSQKFLIASGPVCWSKLCRSARWRSSSRCIVVAVVLAGRVSCFRTAQNPIRPARLRSLRHERNDDWDASSRPSLLSSCVHPACSRSSLRQSRTQTRLPARSLANNQPHEPFCGASQRRKDLEAPI